MTNLATSSPAAEAWALMQRLFGPQRKRFMALAARVRAVAAAARRAQGARSRTSPVAMSELAGILGCDNSNVTGIVDRLEYRGLVERRPAEHDRRVKLLALTERRAASCAPRSATGCTRRPTSSPRLSPEDQRALRDLLQRAFEVLSYCRSDSGRGGRPDVLRRRADQPPLALLLEDVGAPAGDARAGEHRREQVGRHLGGVEHDRRPELDVGGQHAVGLARLQLGQRGLLERLGDLEARGADLAAPCGAARGRAGPRRGRRGGRSPSAARRGRARP